MANIRELVVRFDNGDMITDEEMNQLIEAFEDLDHHLSRFLTARYKLMHDDVRHNLNKLYAYRLARQEKL